jgi:methylated-DNA-[protein]-cysteine S-methyltransferase
MTYYTIYSSPVGELLIQGDGDSLTELSRRKGGGVFGPGEIPRGWTRDDKQFSKAIEQLDEYFDGSRTEFGLELHLEGTDFQLRVWESLRRIPYGETVSYGELAEEIGAPGAARAVGSANGRNPVGIVIPCHRVIAAGGALGGYGGGLDMKSYLLDLESSVISRRGNPSHGKVASRTAS